MPQVQLPLFPAGVTPINDQLACTCRDGQVVDLNGHLPVFTHGEHELPAFRLFTTQLIVNGAATQGEIVRAFGVPAITVKRSVKRYRTAGVAAFFAPPKPRPGRKLTPELLPRAQALFDQGLAVPEVSGQTGVLANTLHKAIRAGRLVRRTGVEKKTGRPGPR
jgi:transposase-like protein